MKKLPTIFYSFLGVSLLFVACQQEVSPAAGLPDVSFNQEVMPIIASNCTAAGCHGLENTEEFTLLSYDDVINHGEVNAGDANDSKLYELITAPTGDVMPPSPNQPLTNEQVALVYLWILQGAKNN